MAEVFIISAAWRLADGHNRSASCARSAVTSALSRVSLDGRRLAAVFIAAGAHPEQPDAAIRRLGLDELGIGGNDRRRVPHVLTRSSVQALHLAWQAVEMGLYELVMCVADGAAAGDGGPDAWPAASVVRPHAIAAQRYMSASGATPEHMAKVAAKNRRNGALNPGLAGTGSVEPGAVLASEMIDCPLRRLMVAPPGGGAAAVIFASRVARRQLGGRAPRMRASALAIEERLNDGRAARMAYHRSGVGPEEVDCAEVDDVTAAAELGAYEALEFVPWLYGPELIDSGFTELRGVLPVNTSGGMLSLGASAATGIAQLCELVGQLEGDGGSRQVPGARLGILHARDDRAAAGAATLAMIVSSR